MSGGNFSDSRNSGLTIPVHFYSYFKDFTNCPAATVTLPEGATVQELLQELNQRFPRMAGLQDSLLVAVGVEYQGRSYQLQPGDEVSLFPPVQGG